MRIHQTGLLDYDRERATPGFTIVAPNGLKEVYILDMEGNEVHAWHVPTRAGGAQLLPGGNILLTEWPNEDAPRGREALKMFRERDWDGNIVWEYEAPAPHHDYARKANGNTVYIGFERMRADATQRIQGGIPGSELADGGVLGDYLREVNPAGETVWQWSVQDDMEIEAFPLPPLSSRDEFAHANAMDVLPNEDVLVSFRRSPRQLFYRREK